MEPHIDIGHAATVVPRYVPANCPTNLTGYASGTMIIHIDPVKVEGVLVGYNLLLAIPL